MYTRESSYSRPLQIRSEQLGWFDPATFTSIIGAINPLNLFGKGRREADLITQGPLPGIVDTLSRLRSELGVGAYWYGCEPIATTVPTERLRTIRTQLEQIRAEYLGFLRDRSIFTDGRASGQAATGDMPNFDGTSNYGDFAAGGSPVSVHPTNGRPVCGGMIGGIDAELARRASVPATAQPATAAPGQGEPAGNFWDRIWTTVASPAPDAQTSSTLPAISSSGPAYSASGGGPYGGGYGVPPLQEASVVPSAGGMTAGLGTVGWIGLALAAYAIMSGPPQRRRS